ncbi:MAG: hypothetical protein P1P88_04720 [Bacteroidales bacterium]|nr:hypothetical protein [Bacteroidales bacterium]
MSKYTDYTNYFKKLATELLGHSDTEKHFFRKGLEEFLNGLSTNVNYPAMLLEEYDFRITDNGADNVMKPFTAAFIICDNVPDIEDYDRQDTVMDSTEEIVDKIYNRIRAAIRPPYQEFFKYAQLGNVQASPVKNKADGNYGWYVTIEILSIHNTTII